MASLIVAVGVVEVVAAVVEAIAIYLVPILNLSVRLVDHFFLVISFAMVSVVVHGDGGDPYGGGSSLLSSTHSTCLSN